MVMRPSVKLLGEGSDKTLSVRFADTGIAIEFEGNWTGADVRLLQKRLPTAYNLYKRDIRRHNITIEPDKTNDKEVSDDRASE